MAKLSTGMITLIGAFAALITVPGIAARWTADGHEVVEMGRQNHDLVNRYIEPARHAAQRDFSSPERTMAVADEWIALYRQKVLLDIPQTWPEDTTRDGVKRQILDARNSIVFGLFRHSRAYRHQNELASAIACEGRAFQLLEIMDRADLSSASASFSYQNMILGFWELDPPEFRAQQRQYLLPRPSIQRTLADISTLFLREQTLEISQRRNRIIKTSASDVADLIRKAPVDHDSLCAFAGEISKPDKASAGVSLVLRTAIRRAADQKRLLEQLGFQEPVVVAKNDAP